MESGRPVPVWVCFPELFPHLRHPDVLSLIISAIGRPIGTNGFTASNEKLMFARVLIEVFSEHEFKKAMELEGPNGITLCQRVEYEWLPIRCNHRQSFGHFVQHYRFPRVNVDLEIVENDKVSIGEAEKKAEEPRQRENSLQVQSPSVMPNVVKESGVTIVRQIKLLENKY